MNTLEFIKEIDDNLTIVDFWAPWCGPCKVLSPIIDKIAEGNPEIKVMKVNVDESKELASHFGIRNIPTVIVFKEQKEVERVLGAKPQTFFQELIESHNN